MAGTGTGSSARLRTSCENSGRGTAFWQGSTVLVRFLVRRLRAQARSHAGFEGCLPGQLTAIPESGVFLSSTPGRLFRELHPVGGSPVQQLACAPGPFAESSCPEYPWGSTLAPPPSTNRDTCVSPIMAPSVRFRAQSSRLFRSHGSRRFRCSQQLLFRAASKHSRCRAVGPVAIPQALPSPPVSERFWAACDHPDQPTFRRSNTNSARVQNRNRPF